VSYVGVALDATAPPRRFPLVEGVTGRPATRDDFPRLIAFMAMPEFQGNRLKQADLERRYRRGDICYVAEHRGELATLAWLRFDSAAYPVAGIDVPLRTDEVYQGAIFTHPRLRSRGIIPTAWAVAQRPWLLDRGITKVYGWIRDDNHPMLRTIRRLGWMPAARVTQYFVWAGARLSVVNIVLVDDAAGMPSDWCSKDRISFRTGLRLFRRGPVRV
jgi:GNAT superfamily N-acetyltransferase